MFFPQLPSALFRRQRAERRRGGGGLRYRCCFLWLDAEEAALAPHHDARAPHTLNPKPLTLNPNATAAAPLAGRGGGRAGALPRRPCAAHPKP